MVLPKHELEKALLEENKAISAGILKEDNPLDLTEDFRLLCEACRGGDLKLCHEKISQGVNINARDNFDCTPLILASLCGHYEVVKLLLEAGALCERDTFQGERCLHNALNDRIKRLLEEHDYSKSANPLQPYAAHVTSLLGRERPETFDVLLSCGQSTLRAHRFILAARSPYFARKLAAAPETASIRLPNSIPVESMYATLKFLYLGELAGSLGRDDEEDDVLRGIEILSRQLEVERLFDFALNRSDRRLTRQRMTDELDRGRNEIFSWFKDNVLRHKMAVDSDKVGDVKWDRSNAMSADVLLRADETPENESESGESVEDKTTGRVPSSIPIGSFTQPSRPLGPQSRRTSVIYPVHKAMLIRSEYFLTMFSSGFKEAQESEYLQVISVDCPPDVLEVILAFLYAEMADFSLEIALDVLYTADLMLIDKLKVRAATIISSLASGTSAVELENTRGKADVEDSIDIYEIIRTAWAVRVPRLEHFGARHIAFRLERYIEEPQFAVLVKESADRVKDRQETDTIELIDDIRYYLSEERFRDRFEDAGLEEMMDEKLEAGIRDADGNLVDPSDELLGQYDAEEEVENGEDKFEEDTKNFRILDERIDALLESLKLEA